MTRLADHCPDCGELTEPSIVLPLRTSTGVECIYGCGCHPELWVASIAYPAGSVTGSPADPIEPEAA